MRKYWLFIVATVSLLPSCDSAYIDLEKQEGAIYSMLIDRMAKPFPPPPPPPKDGSEIKPINIDSIRKVKVELVVDTTMFHVSETVALDKKYSEYRNLVDSISSLTAKPVKTEYIKSEEGHTLVFGDSLEDSKAEHPQIIGFSQIAFNERKNRAALYAGHSTHPLASYLDLYLLKKINGRWEIVFETTVEVS